MRYRADQAVAGMDLDAGLFATMALYTLLIGVGFAVVGWRARQWWLLSVGVLLAGASVVYLAYVTVTT